jgi:hypothetical protein
MLTINAGIERRLRERLGEMTDKEIAAIRAYLCALYMEAWSRLEKELGMPVQSHLTKYVSENPGLHAKLRAIIATDARPKLTANEFRDRLRQLRDDAEGRLEDACTCLGKDDGARIDELIADAELHAAANPLGRTTRQVVEYVTRAERIDLIVSTLARLANHSATPTEG